MTDSIEIYTDGSCLKNPGVGGWACVLVWNGVERGLSGAIPYTTNNQMELLSVIQALKLLKGPSNISIISDSKYVVDGVNKGWVFNWINNGSIKSRPNNELWLELVDLLSNHNYEFKWVKGHLGNHYNEMCDRMAVEQARLLQSQLG